MRVLVDSYNSVTQNASGGVQVKIRRFVHVLQNKLEVKLFDKWSDSIKDYDVIHIIKAHTDSYDLMKIALKLNKPVIISSIIPNEKTMKIKIGKLLYRIFKINTGYSLIGQMLKEACAIIAETKLEAKFIADIYEIDEKKIHVIPNGVELPAEGTDCEATQLGVGREREYVLQVGRFDRNKNQLNTIKALKGTGIPLVLVGGPDKSDEGYFEQCKEAADDNVTFLGWIDNNNPLLAGVYSNSKVVILPSFKETFGISILEGGIAGANLVISRDLPIVNEYRLNEVCEIIEPSDIDDMREKIKKAYYAPKSSTNKEFFLHSFSWEFVVDQHIQIYESVYNKRS